MKKILVAVCAAIMVIGVGASALAVNTADSTAKTSNPVSMKGDRQDRDHQKLTDEQKAQMREKMQDQKEKFNAIQEKWSALTDAQRKEVTGIQDEINALRIEKIDKLLSLGVIDKDTADQMKQRISDQSKNVGDKLPMPFGGKGFGMGNFGDKKASQ